MYDKQLLYIKDFRSKRNNQLFASHLLCRFNTSGEQIDIRELLEKVCEKVFLAAPSTQIFLFLSKDHRRLLFKIDNNESYPEKLSSAKSHLPGLFTYDFIDINLLVDVFKVARDKDFEQATRTGDYGNHYRDLIAEINSLLTNKQINVNPDLSGITFKMQSGDQKIELNPEDLSHGELKRLCIYMWLKYRNIEDALVLMDEVEIAFHPDWQYRIVSDLQEWAPSNQYILGTHSHELCQALSPAHVKEIPPKLLPIK